MMDNKNILVVFFYLLILYCFTFFATALKFSCTTVYDAHASRPSIPRCRHGEFAAILESLGLTYEDLKPFSDFFNLSEHQNFFPLSKKTNQRRLLNVDTLPIMHNDYDTMPSAFSHDSTTDLRENNKTFFFDCADHHIHKNSLITPVGSMNTKLMQTMIHPYVYRMANSILSSYVKKKNDHTPSRKKRSIPSLPSTTLLSSSSSSLPLVLPEKLIMALSNQALLKFVTGLLKQPFTITETTDGSMLFKIASSNLNTFKNACDSMNLNNLPNDFLAETDSCTFLDLFQTILGCRDLGDWESYSCHDPSFSNATTFLPPVCNPSVGPYANKTVSTKEFVDLQLTSLNVSQKTPLNETLPSEFMDKDGLDLFFLYRSTQEAAVLTQRYVACGDSAVENTHLVPGWDIDYIIKVREEGELKADFTPGQCLPYAFISKPRYVNNTKKNNDNERCRFLLTFRPTLTMFEWKMNLDANLTQLFSEESLNSQEQGHAGFHRIASAMWAPLQDYLSDAYDDCNNNILDIIITGHSLGAGIAQIIALWLNTRLPMINNQRWINVRFAGFATPVVFNPPAALRYSQLVDGRVINADLDPIPFAPCSGNAHSAMALLTCSSKRNLVKNNTNNFFVQTPGRIQFPLEPMLQSLGIGYDILQLEIKLVPSFNATVDIRVPAPLQFGISHICAYNCRLSQYCTNSQSIGWSCNSCPSTIDGFKFSINV